MTVSNQNGVSTAALGMNLSRYSESFELEMRHFIGLITGVEKNPRVQGEDCIRNSQIGEACLRSIKSGKFEILE